MAGGGLSMSNLSKPQFDTFYHRTDNAEAILKSGKLKPSSTEDQVFVSTHHDRGTVGFGKSIVEVELPKKAPSISINKGARIVGMNAEPDDAPTGWKGKWWIYAAGLTIAGLIALLIHIL